MLAFIERTIDVLSAVFVGVAVAVLAAMAVLGTADVLLFNLAGRAVPAANEIASAMLPLVVILAMSHAQRTGAHIRVDLFERFMSPAFARAVGVLALAVAAVVLAFMAVGAWDLALKSIAVRERAIAAVRFPLWPSKLAFAIGASLLALQVAVQLASNLAGRPREG